MIDGLTMVAQAHIGEITSRQGAPRVCDNRHPSRVEKCPKSVHGINVPPLQF